MGGPFVYRIVGNLFEAVPVLTEEIKKLKG